MSDRAAEPTDAVGYDTSPRDRVWMAGLMGCGKTTVGTVLAGRLRCSYIDNDLTIAKSAGRTTTELSRIGGELHQREAAYVRQVAALPAPVVAGIPASAADRPDDLVLLHASGLLVYLRCSLDTLLERVRSDPPRPFLVGNIEDVLGEMLEVRGPQLEEVAGLVVDGSKPVVDIVDTILRALANRRAAAPPATPTGPPDADA